MSKRVIYIAIILISMISGLFARRMNIFLPEWINAYLGDIIWAFMVYFFIGLLFFKRNKIECLIISVLFSYSIEFSQLIQNDFFKLLRSYKIGGLILGYGFLWSDLISYLTGISIAFALDKRYFSNDENYLNSKN